MTDPTDTIERLLGEHSLPERADGHAVSWNCSCGDTYYDITVRSGRLALHRAHVAAEIAKALGPTLHRAWMAGVQDQWAHQRPGMRVLETTGPYWGGPQASQEPRSRPNEADRHAGQGQTETSA